jgi:hypothetical protein
MVLLVLPVKPESLARLVSKAKQVWWGLLGLSVKPVSKEQPELLVSQEWTELPELLALQGLMVLLAFRATPASKVLLVSKESLAS